MCENEITTLLISVVFCRCTYMYTSLQSTHRRLVFSSFCWIYVFRCVKMRELLCRFLWYFADVLSCTLRFRVLIAALYFPLFAEFMFLDVWKWENYFVDFCGILPMYFHVHFASEYWSPPCVRGILLNLCFEMWSYFVADSVSLLVCWLVRVA